MPQLDISTYASQIFWLVVCFGILCVFMATFIAPRIGLSLHHRTKVLEEHTMAAKKLLAEAEELHQNSIQHLSQARHDASQHLHQAIYDLTCHRHEKLREFDHKLQLELQELSKKLFQQKQEILNSSQELISHLVETIFFKVTNTSVPTTAVNKAFKTIKTGDTHV
ncbi:hypothetical protein [Candidatus Paracaedibacter symbiosus]|uniref:F0F1 ATP synthase subunit B family protein n=1 Tax=Candidatus Paracaedibacter symbiosus TaxID=244582 RepID=UPI00068A6F99|nr:hypothetical protein [Candidatus Paracaedibacter symbiosus]